MSLLWLAQELVYVALSLRESIAYSCSNSNVLNQTRIWCQLTLLTYRLLNAELTLERAQSRRRCGLAGRSKGGGAGNEGSDGKGLEHGCVCYEGVELNFLLWKKCRFS
jgi:hypothetical protein